MNSLPLDVILEKNKLASTGTWTLLLELIPKDTQLAHEYYVKNTENVVYGGNTYLAANFALDAAKESADGEMPTMELTVYDPALALRPFLEANSGGVGASVKLTPINTNLTNSDWSSLERTYKVVSCQDDAEAVNWSVGGPTTLHLRVPPDSYQGDYCRFHYGLAASGYIGCAFTPFAITGVGHAGTTPVTITVAAHPYVTGDRVNLATVNGITPALAGTYTVTKVDANSFTLDGTNGGTYSGTYTSGGKAHFASCRRTLAQCRLRSNSARFGGFAGMRAKTIRIVA